MKRCALLFLLLLYGNAQADSWTQKAMMPGDDRGAAAGFSLNGKGYIGTGIKYQGPTQFHNDFWEYDPVTDIWTQKANFGGTARSGAIGFSVLDKGYIAFGYDANIPQTDVWEYDPLNNMWTQKASLPAPGRDYTVAFSIDSFAYIGTGYNTVSTNYQDFWQFNPFANTWTQKTNVGGGTRSSAMAFSVGSKGYIGGGYSAGFVHDFWEYDPALNAWAQKANIPGGGRSDGVAFAIGNYGYVLTGQFSVNTAKDLQQYDPLSNTWTQKTDLTGAARTNAVAFAIGNKGYIGTGYDPGFNTLKDFWEYAPDGTTGMNESSVYAQQFIVYPNPSKGILNIKSVSAEFHNAKIILQNANGKILFTHSLDDIAGAKQVDATFLKNGMYFYEIKNDCTILARGKIVIQK